MKNKYLIKFMMTVFGMATLISSIVYIRGEGIDDLLFYFSGLDKSETVWVKNIDLFAFFKWLWVYFPFWLIAGYFVEVYYANQKLTQIRYGNRKKWYNEMYRELFLIFLAYLAGLWILLLSGGFLQFVVIAVHAFFMMSIFILIKELFNSGVTAFFTVLVLEVFSYMAGEGHALPGGSLISFWGMASRFGYPSNLSEFRLYSVIAVQLAIFYSILVLVKKFRRECRA